MANIYVKWCQRHRNSANLHLHILGFITISLAMPAVLIMGYPILAIAILACSLCMQGVGHLVENTPPCLFLAGSFILRRCGVIKIM